MRLSKEVLKHFLFLRYHNRNYAFAQKYESEKLKNLIKHTEYTLMCDIWSIILHFKRRIRVKFQSKLISIESMASKDTPKKLYQRRTESTGSISRCRLCNSVADSRYCKNLFRDKNKTV